MASMLLVLFYDYCAVTNLEPISRNGHFAPIAVLDFYDIVYEIHDYVFHWIGVHLAVSITSVLPNHPSAHLGQVKLCFGPVKFFTIILKLCVTCPNILKMGIKRGATKSLGRALITYDGVSQLNDHIRLNHGCIFSESIDINLFWIDMVFSETSGPFY